MIKCLLIVLSMNFMKASYFCNFRRDTRNVFARHRVSIKQDSRMCTREVEIWT